MIITIDGPAGSGKSTAARNLARELGITYLDSGAIYRAVTLEAMRAGVDLADEASVVRIAENIDLEMIPGDDGVRVLVAGRDVSEEIRSAEVTDSAHHVADCAAARAVIEQLLRRIGRKLGDFVAEGRDQGSVVFPNADVKFYLVADPRRRAERRRAEMAARGESVGVEEVLESIIARDRRDSSRNVGPLVKPAGAITVDTTGKSIEQTAAELVSHVRAATK